MHVDWSCYALIVLEGSNRKGAEVLSYRARPRRDGRNPRRLPGGEKVEGESDPMQTLVRTVKQQTGIDLRKEIVRRLASIETRVQRPEGSRRAKKYTHSERYYLVKVPIDEFIDRKHFALREDEELTWVTPHSILAGDDFEPKHRKALERYLNN